MESSYLNSPSPENDELEARLRTHLSVPTLRDDGFSDWVMATLPAVEDRAFKFRRQLFCGAGLSAGLAVATIALVRPGHWAPKFPSLLDALAGAGEQLSAPPVALALGMAALSLGFAFRDRMRLFPRL